MTRGKYYLMIALIVIGAIMFIVGWWMLRTRATSNYILAGVSLIAYGLFSFLAGVVIFLTNNDTVIQTYNSLTEYLRQEY